jgi:hypothetical protein
VQVEVLLGRLALGVRAAEVGKGRVGRNHQQRERLRARGCEGRLLAILNVVGANAANGVEQSRVAVAAHCGWKQGCAGLKSSDCGAARGDGWKVGKLKRLECCRTRGRLLRAACVHDPFMALAAALAKAALCHSLLVCPSCLSCLRAHSAYVNAADRWRLSHGPINAVGTVAERRHYCATVSAGCGLRIADSLILDNSQSLVHGVAIVWLLAAAAAAAHGCSLCA